MGALLEVVREVEEGSPDDVIVVGFPTPPSFSVTEYIEYVKETGYTQHNWDFNFDGLLADLPEIKNRFSNDIAAKAMLSHCYGEMLSKHFRNWIREQMDPDLELPCGGASIGADGEGML